MIQLIQAELSRARIDSGLLVSFISVPPAFKGHGWLEYLLLMTNHRSTKKEAEICDISSGLTLELITLSLPSYSVN